MPVIHVYGRFFSPVPPSPVAMRSPARGSVMMYAGLGIVAQFAAGPPRHVPQQPGLADLLAANSVGEKGLAR